jgi:hypothetical protein
LKVTAKIDLNRSEGIITREDEYIVMTTTVCISEETIDCTTEIYSKRENKITLEESVSTREETEFDFVILWLIRGLRGIPKDL